MNTNPNGRVTGASDGSYRPNTNQSGYGIVLYDHKTSTIYTHGAKCPPHIHNSSLYAELHGDLSITKLIALITHNYPANSPTPIYIDNSEVHRRLKTPIQHHNYQDKHSPLTYELMAQNKPVSISWQWIHSHEATQTLPQKLNDIADSISKRFSSNHTTLPQYIPLPNAPFICYSNGTEMASIPYHNNIATNSYKDIRKFLQRKWEWTDEQYHSINWQALATTYQTYPTIY